MTTPNEKPSKEEKPSESGCKCQECGRRFKVDICVPSGLWDRIKPIGKPHGAGLLCPTCIMQAIETEFGFSAFDLIEISAQNPDGIAGEPFDYEAQRVVSYLSSIYEDIQFPGTLHKAVAQILRESQRDQTPVADGDWVENTAKAICVELGLTTTAEIFIEEIIRAALPPQMSSLVGTVESQQLTSLQWLLNKAEETPRAQIRTLLDGVGDVNGVSNREHLKALCKRMVNGQSQMPTPDGKPTDTEMLNWLEAECHDVRCSESRVGLDDTEVSWTVISHHMAEPKERDEGYGGCPRSAIRDAMLPKGDPRRMDYVPPDCEKCGVPETVCECPQPPTSEEVLG